MTPTPAHRATGRGRNSTRDYRPASAETGSPWVSGPSDITSSNWGIGCTAKHQARNHVLVGGFTRRQALAAVGIFSAGGAGLTASEGLSSASVSGQADIEAEQALTVRSVNVTGDSDVDADFTRVTDDNTGLQVAVEGNNGDTFTAEAEIQNASAGTLAVRIRVATPPDISIENVKPDGVVQSDTNQYVTNIGAGTVTLKVQFKIADTADPGARNVDIDMNPLSTDNG